MYKLKVILFLIKGFAQKGTFLNICYPYKGLQNVKIFSASAIETTTLQSHYYKKPIGDQ